MGVGTSLSLSSTLSGDAVAFLWDACSTKTGLTVEMINTIFTILLLTIVVKFDITKLGIGTLICPIIQNFGIWTTNLMLSTISITSGIMDIAIGLIGISILSIGCGIFAYVNLGISAYLGTGKIISEKLNINYGLVIMITDGLCFIFATILSQSIAIGPLIATCISGPLIDLTMRSMPVLSKYRKGKNYENNISM